MVNHLWYIVLCVTTYTNLTMARLFTDILIKPVSTAWAPYGLGYTAALFVLCFSALLDIAHANIEIWEAWQHIHGLLFFT